MFDPVKGIGERRVLPQLPLLSFVHTRQASRCRGKGRGAAWWTIRMHHVENGPAKGKFLRCNAQEPDTPAAL